VEVLEGFFDDDETVDVVECEVQKWTTAVGRTPFGSEGSTPSGCWPLVQSVDIGAVMVSSLASTANKIDEDVKKMHRRLKNPSYPPVSESGSIRHLQRRAFFLGRAMVKAGNFLMRMNDCGPDDPWYRKSLAINMIVMEDGTEGADAVLDLW